MKNLKKIIAACKGCVLLLINEHRNMYSTVEDYFSAEEKSQIDATVFSNMVEKNTIIELQFYYDTPNGSYTVFHHDIDTCVREALDIIESLENNSPKPPPDDYVEDGYFE